MEFKTRESPQGRTDPSGLVTTCNGEAQGNEERLITPSFSNS